MSITNSPEDAVNDWINRVDSVDPFFGSQKDLTDLLESAPTQELRSWLADQIEKNKAFEAKLHAGMQ